MMKVLTAPVAALLCLGVWAAPALAATPKVHVEPEVTFALPPATAGCGGAVTLPSGAIQIPITVSTVAGQVAEIVNVCLDGEGPYPFVIDTGAGESIIDAHLAATLHLPHAGAKTGFEGIGCSGTSQPVSVANWTAAGLPLAAQTLTAATLPDFGTKGQPVGLLGSDVLSRFDLVRIDFVAQTLTVGQKSEGPAIAGNSVVHGPKGPLPLQVLERGQVGTTVPLTVDFVPGDTSLNVKVRVAGSGPLNFVVDTGSSQSVVNTTVTRARHLAHTDLAQVQATVCSTITVPLVQSGIWSLPGVTLHPQMLGSTNFGPISSGGTAGLLGSDQLIKFGWVVFDYRGGELILG